MVHSAIISDLLVQCYQELLSSFTSYNTIGSIKPECRCNPVYILQSGTQTQDSWDLVARCLIDCWFPYSGKALTLYMCVLREDTGETSSARGNCMNSTKNGSAVWGKTDNGIMEKGEAERQFQFHDLSESQFWPNYPSNNKENRSMYVVGYLLYPT